MNLKKFCEKLCGNFHCLRIWNHNILKFLNKHEEKDHRNHFTVDLAVDPTCKSFHII